VPGGVGPLATGVAGALAPVALPRGGLTRAALVQWQVGTATGGAAVVVNANQLVEYYRRLGEAAAAGQRWWLALAAVLLLAGAVVAAAAVAISVSRPPGRSREPGPAHPAASARSAAPPTRRRERKRWPRRSGGVSAKRDAAYRPPERCRPCW